MKKIETSKNYHTRNGCPARIYCVDGGPIYSVHGAYFIGDRWQVASWDRCGSYTYGNTSLLDLIEAPTKQSREILIEFLPHSAVVYASIDDAIRHGSLGPCKPVARKTITVEFEEGEGL